MAPRKFSEIDNQSKIRQIFTIQILHIYGKVCSIADAQLLNTLHEILPSLLMNIKQIEDTFLGSCLTGHQSQHRLTSLNHDL